MAHSLHRKKRLRQNVKRRMRNQVRKSTLKTTVRKTTEVLAKGSAADAEKQLREAVKLIDRQATQRALHPNAAARKKSRLAKKLNQLKAGKTAAKAGAK